MAQSTKYRTLAVAAGLAAFSAVVQLIHVGYQSPQFGMWIDVVAVTWIMAFFLFGLRTAFLVSLTGALVITLFAPDTWLGASMKLVASLPMFLAPGLLIMLLKKKLSFYSKPLNLVIPVLIGLGLRILLVLPLNYFYAIPIWTGMSTAQAWAAIPWYVIVIFNLVQGIIDVALAWVLVFKFRLTRFAGKGN